MKRIRKMDILLFMLWFCVFPIIIPDKITYILQLLFSCFIMLYSFRELFRIPWFPAVTLFSISMIISCMVNRETIQITHVLRGISYGILIIDVFCFLHKYIRIFGTRTLYEKLYKISRLYFIVIVAWITIVLILGKVSADIGIEDEYLILQGKFNTAYVLIFFLIFFWLAWNGNRVISCKRKKYVFLCLFIVSIIICNLVQVSTGLVGITVFVALLICPSKISSIIRKPLIFVLLILASMMIVFFIDVILKQPVIYDLIINVLHEDMSLTGRTYLYALLYPLLFKSGLWGGGFGSYVSMQLGYHGWFNAQNGLSEIILTYGFAGGITFLITVLFAAVSNKANLKGLNAGIIAFVVIAIVEVPFDVRFILLLALFAFSRSESNLNVNDN